MAVTQEEGGAGSGGRGHVDAGRAWWRLPGYHPAESHRRATAVIRASARFYPLRRQPPATEPATGWVVLELDVVQTQRAGALPRALKRSALHLLSTSK